MSGIAPSVTAAAYVRTLAAIGRIRTDGKGRYSAT